MPPLVAWLAALWLPVVLGVAAAVVAPLGGLSPSFACGYLAWHAAVAPGWAGWRLVRRGSGCSAAALAGAAVVVIPYALLFAMSAQSSAWSLRVLAGIGLMLVPAMVFGSLGGLVAGSRRGCSAA